MIKTMIATTIEQSKKLIELGLSPKTADMHYGKWDNDEDEEYHLKCGGLPKLDFKYTTNIPAWSLSALLGLIKPFNKNTYTIQGTLDGGAIISFEEVTCVAFQESNILDAVFEMICYLIENKLI